MGRGRVALGALVLLGAATTPTPASAAGAPDGASSLEVDGFYKSSWTALRLPTGLVEATAALSATGAQVRAALPPELADAVPVVTPLPSAGWIATHSARLWGRGWLGHRLELQAGYELDEIVASDAQLAAGGTLGVAAASAGQPRRRWVDLRATLAAERGTRLQHNLDLLALTWRAPGADVTVGRQVLSWGSGRLWNPTDLFSPFSPAEIDREVRHGVDAVRVSVPLAATTQVEILYLPQAAAADQGAVLRAQSNVHGFDLAPSVAKYLRDAVFGFDFVGDIGVVGVHGEAAATTELDVDERGARDQFLRAVAGVDLLPHPDLAVTAEYAYSGFGATRAEDYVEVLRSERVARGEIYGAGRQYLGLVAAWQASDLVSIQGVSITNLQDPSSLLVPVVEWWAHQDILVRCGGSVPFGRRPDPRAIAALTPSTLLAGGPEAQATARSLGLRSEYGAAALGFFVMVAIHPL